jgi:3-isopropylmalate dehydrogenase
VGVLPGEGVGPEVVRAALDVLSALDAVGTARFEVRIGPEPPKDLDETGGLTGAEEAFCAGVFAEEGAVLCGARGGRFVYELRRRFDLFCKLTPIRPLEPLLGIGPCRAEAASGADLLFVRENVGGLYFGSHGEQRVGEVLSEVSHTFRYERHIIDRILGVAVALAERRRGLLTVVLKRGGVPSVSAIWRAAAEELPGVANLDLEFLEVDNACYQVVADAPRFDVLVSPNMFGDVIADVAVLLLGSRGLSYSANFGDHGRAVYQTAHGAALDLAGTDCANPVGQILSLASLLEESFGRPEPAHAVRRATTEVLADGWRTADTMAPGCTQVGTRELGKRIAERARELAFRAGAKA